MRVRGSQQAGPARPCSPRLIATASFICALDWNAFVAEVRAGRPAVTSGGWSHSWERPTSSCEPPAQAASGVLGGVAPARAHASRGVTCGGHHLRGAGEEGYHPHGGRRRCACTQRWRWTLHPSGEEGAAPSDGIHRQHDSRCSCSLSGRGLTRPRAPVRPRSAPGTLHGGRPPPAAPERHSQTTLGAGRCVLGALLGL